MLLQKIGTSGDLNTKVQESLISFNRLMTFAVKCTVTPSSPHLAVSWVKQR